MGVVGNETADRLAKEALKHQHIEVEVSFSSVEHRALIKKEINTQWQRMWDSERRGRHYFNIKKRVGNTSAWGNNRREQVIMTRLRLGHCGLASSLHVIGKHQNGLCENCKRKETVVHVLMECSKYTVQRRVLFSRILELGFKSVSIKKFLGPAEYQQEFYEALMDFIFDTGLFNTV